MKLISKDEKKELRKQFPEQYFHRTRHHVYMECRPAITKALHALRTVACMVLIALVLTACGRRSGLVYSDDAITVTRDGARLCVMDVQTEEAYRFTTHRVKRAQTAEEAARRAVCKTVSDTDTLTIMTVRNELIIVEKDAGKTVCIR